MINDVESGYVAANMVSAIEQMRCDITHETTRPSVLYRPAISLDGNKWCALYGDDLVCGVSGFGDSPDAAMRDFDAQWITLLAQSQEVQ